MFLFQHAKILHPWLLLSHERRRGQGGEREGPLALLDRTPFVDWEGLERKRGPILHELKRLRVQCLWNQNCSFDIIPLKKREEAIIDGSGQEKGR